MELAEETVRVQGGKSWQRTLAYLLFAGLKLSTSCVIFQGCPMVFCLLALFGKGQKDAQQPLHPGKPGKATPARKPPCVAGLGFRWGNAVLARSRPIWATQGRVWQKEKKAPLPPPVGEGFGGMKKEQVKGCGSVNRPTPSSQRPADPVASGFFRGVNLPIFRGRFGGLGVTDGVRNTKFPGGKPFFRVSPPGSTKG